MPIKGWQVLRSRRDLVGQARKLNRVSVESDLASPLLCNIGILTGELKVMGNSPDSRYDVLKQIEKRKRLRPCGWERFRKLSFTFE